MPQPLSHQIGDTILSFVRPGYACLSFSVPQIKLEVFDVRGRRLRTVVKREESAGARTVFFDGRDRDGMPLANGQYFARLTVRAPEGIERLTRKFSLVR